MDAEITLSVDDLDTLTAKDLEGVVVINRPDEEKWTEEHLKKLNGQAADVIVVIVVVVPGREIADMRSRDYSLDPTALEEQLRNMANADARRYSASVQTTSSPHPTPSHSPSPGPETRAIMAKRFAENVEHYNYLIEAGGRPAFPLELSESKPEDFDFGEHETMIQYWGQTFINQKMRWVGFLDFQQQNRSSMETFTEYQQAVHDHRKTEGIEGGIHLHFDVEQQSKVDQWKEYHYFNHMHVLGLREKAEPARKTREQNAKDWKAGRRNSKVPESMGWVYSLKSEGGKTAEEVNLRKFMTWIHWIEGELPKIEQECAVSANKGGEDNTPHSAEEEDEAKESTTLPLANAAGAPPTTEMHLRRSGRSARSKKKPTASLGVIGTPRVSSRKGAKPVVSTKHLSHADLGTASSAAPNHQRTAGAGRATGENDLTKSPPKKHPRSEDTSTKPPAEASSLRRSQRLIDKASRKTSQQQAVQETASSSLIAPEAEVRKGLRAQQVKKNSKRAPPQSKPQGVAKTGTSSRASPRAAKRNISAKRTSYTKKAVIA
ncbi:hypothetical protein ACJ72_04798 [Emergomyces africanus]|uniref:Uncharacterized protein n=1 Tax=Emergomyces africanus TaxID=1955775 RepID=A0A1B7NVR0_9EURO|nr:hypothetical protein ACJ72_04798 [Emergomyces africanus]